MAVHLHSEEHGETMRQAFNWPPASPAPAAPEAEASAADPAESAPAPDTPPDPVPAPPPDTPEEEDVPPEEEEGEGEEAPAQAASPSDTLSPGIQKRFNRFTRQLRDREREILRQDQTITELRAQMATLTQLVGQQRPANDDPQTPPQDLREEDFSSYGEFARAVARQEARREAQALIEAEMARQREARQAEAALQAQQSLVQQWQAALGKARERYEDFDEVVTEAQDIPVSEAVVKAVQQSAEGGVLYYYLATHPDEAARLSTLSESAAYREVGKLEVQLSADPPASPSPPVRVAPTPRPPARSTPAVRPITPVGGSANALPAVDRGSLAPRDYYKLREKEGVPQR